MNRQVIAFSIMEFVTLAAFQFLLFKIVVANLGTEQLGVWSLLISSVQIAKFFDPGLASGSLRFMASASREGDSGKVFRIISTAFSATAVIYLILIAIAYFPLKQLIIFAIPEHTELAFNVFPYALISLYAQTMSGVLLNSLVYIAKVPWKSSIVLISSLLQLSLSVFLIHDVGLVGLAVAQTLGSGFNVLVAAALLFYHLRPSSKDMIPRSADNITAIASTGFMLQFNSLAWMGFEMLTRVLMSRFGGASYVGLFEVAYRAAAQVRLLFFYAYQSLSASFAAKNNIDGLAELYRKYFSRSIGIGAIFSIFSLFCFLPLSYFVFGHLGNTEIFFSICCFSATFIHIVLMPIEMLAVALGRVQWNLFGTLVKVGVLALCGTMLGFYANEIGIAFGMFLAVLAGGLVTLLVNSRLFAMPLRPSLGELFPIAHLRKLFAKLSQFI